MALLFQNTHRISKLLQMVIQNGANLVVTQWLDDHAEMLSEWGAESRYHMDFIVEKRKTDCAIVQIENFLNQNGIRQQLREELKNVQIMTFGTHNGMSSSKPSPLM